MTVLMKQIYMQIEFYDLWEPLSSGECFEAATGTGKIESIEFFKNRKLSYHVTNMAEAIKLFFF